MKKARHPDDRKQFEKEKITRILAQGNNAELVRRADAFVSEASRSKYCYNFSWLGVPIFQHPEDLIATAEIIWKVKPQVIVDIGFARGGSAIFYASLLKLLGNGGKVVSVDIDIRAHNRDTVEKHPLGRGVQLIEGSSILQTTFEKVKKAIGKKAPVLISLDSLHTEAHVLAELELYAKLVTKGSYVIVFDTVLKKLPRETYPQDHGNRPWDIDNNPGTAVEKFLKNHKQFAIDRAVDNQILISAAPQGYLKRVR